MNAKTDRKTRVSNKIKLAALKPRLVIFRSNKEIYATIIDSNGKVLAFASSLKSSEKNKTLAAQKVGTEIAIASKTNKISEIVFDRRGYKYHGRVAALAESAREAGLKF